MSFSVGILYSAQEFTSYVSTTVVGVDEFKSAFKKFSLASPEDILDVSVRCNWIDFHPDGICRITRKGKDLLLADPEKILRLQLCDLIDADQPPWAAKIPNGRQEAIKYLPDEVHQCFKEAGLLKGWSDEIIEWWDKLSIATRSHKSIANLITGRKAEKLTMDYETKRTGEIPHWQSIESNFSGYDVLSKADTSTSTVRKIEVKGSSLPKNQAFCYVTRNEWKTAELSSDYHFHLWCLREKPLLIDVSKEEMKLHIPQDMGDGAWETAKILFSSFPDHIIIN